jgi:hypothetical protein
MSLNTVFILSFLYNTIIDHIFLKLEPKEDWGTRLIGLNFLARFYWAVEPVDLIPKEVALPLVTFMSTKLL